MADSRLIRECDGESGYQEYKNDLASYAVLADCEYVLKHECPEPIDDPIAAGEWGDDEHPCDDDDERHGTAAPRETVAQRAATIAEHKKADKRLKALILLKAKKDLKKHAMAYKGDSGRELLLHLDEHYASTSSTKLGQLIKRFLSEKLRRCTEILAFNIKKKDQLRELEEADVHVHPAVAVVCYLHNLSAEFETFCQVQMMKDDPDLDKVMAGAVDFASAAQVHYDEAHDHAMYAGGGSSSADVPAWAHALVRGNNRPVCTNPTCRNPGHVIEDCFNAGGGLDHLNGKQRAEWLRTRNPAAREALRKKFAVSGGGGRTKRAVAEMSAEDVEKAMLSISQRQTQQAKEMGNLSSTLHKLKKRKHDIVSAMPEMGLGEIEYPI